jgi:hypothetical protein
MTPEEALSSTRPVTIVTLRSGTVWDSAQSMQGFFQNQPPRRPGGAPELFQHAPDLREYIASCVRSAPVSAARTEALAALGDATVDELWDLAGVPIDWAEVEYEAARQGCTIADIVFDRSGRHPSAS